MLRIFLFLLGCVVALAVAFGLASLPGHVSAEIGNISATAPTGVAALALIILLIIVYFVLRLLGAFFRLPRRFRLWRSGRGRATGDRAVTRTLIALAAGEASAARRNADAARRLLGDTPQTLLLTAEAARLGERSDEAQATFRLLAGRKDGAFLGLRGLLREAILRGDWGEAAALARRAEAAHPGGSWLRRERRRIAIETEDWRSALALADEPARAALAAAAAEAETGPKAALKLAHEALAADPSLPAAALALARRLRTAGRERRAEAVIADAWAEAPHPDLARFALEPLIDPMARVKAAQRLAARNATHPESRFLLAETALGAGLIGDARRHAESLQAEGIAWRRVWLLIAGIARAEAQGKDSAAELEALHAAATADADPEWRCAACGGSAAKWQPVCPHCGVVGRLKWQAPPAVPAPVPPREAKTELLGIEKGAANS
ncbi:MAG: heme biosynthesis HemY N-terminal domain-containing protein [Acetobacteraceae bacterium]